MGCQLPGWSTSVGKVCACVHVMNAHHVSVTRGSFPVCRQDVEEGNQPSQMVPLNGTTGNRYSDEMRAR